MFYRHNKTFWYQFCKHFLKAENSADSLASSCEEYCSFLVTQYETGLLLELGQDVVTFIVFGRYKS